MVIPVVGASPQDAPPPAAVKEFHSYFWWGIFLILVSMAVLQVVAGDGFGMFFTLILAAIVYYMVSDHCANMSMYCLLVFGLISGFESLFGVLTLFSVVGGRSSSTTLITSKDATSVTYETQVKVHPLFDSTQGTKYNIQSGLLVALPIVMLLSALLSWWSFRAYPNSLFSDFDEEAEPIYAQGPPAGQYGGPPRARQQQAPATGATLPDSSRAKGSVLVNDIRAMAMLLRTPSQRLTRVTSIRGCGS
eukprot:CAMPEP_0181448414 /NCGR_PEP_ID=MMETSP1110-20121109/27128_1 /TAXON_ID=174948 /ORGANISM="Symbiodinium sp., Strain CCMP421" /LENGTH=247 /DNA_ID=CAMNT_0023572563 /DNA_START=91 /DNA_END=832 /DNA_ORIENTATION=+